jgi:hypothetical protein
MLAPGMQKRVEYKTVTSMSPRARRGDMRKVPASHSSEMYSQLYPRFMSQKNRNARICVRTFSMKLLLQIMIYVIEQVRAVGKGCNYDDEEEEEERRSREHAAMGRG